MDDPSGHPARWAVASDILEGILESNARRRFPRRWAISASLLATCKKEFAAHESDESTRSGLVERAQELFEQAIGAAEDARSWLEAAGYWLNLGNLHRQYGDASDALAAYQRGYECAEPYADHAGSLLTRLLVNGGVMRLERGRTGDKGRGRAMLERASRADDPFATSARLALAELVLKDKKRDRALGLLESADLLSVPVESLGLVIRLYEELGRGAVVARHLQELVEDLLRERSKTIADLPADWAATRLQTCALLLAGVLLRQGLAIDAFLALDNAAALRFSEATFGHRVAVSGTAPNEHHRAREHHGTIAAILEDTLERLQFVPVEDWRDSLEDHGRSLSTLGPDGAPVLADVVRVLRDATADGRFDLTPVVRARDAAVAQAVEAARLLAKSEPSSDLVGGAVDFAVDEAELRELLSQTPGRVFIRLALDGASLLAVSTYCVEDKVVAKHVTVPCPADLFELLDSFATNPSRANVAESLTQRLSAIDISSVLGESHREAIVLPSTAVARLPLAALGPPGARLLDRVESISWLPNLFPLRQPLPVMPSRAGAYVFAPGERGRTRWHDVGLSKPLPAENSFRDEDATLRAVVTHASHARVVTLYAHGSYVDGRTAVEKSLTPGPAIMLADGDELKIADLGPQWIGIERVELWGCQTGVNLPMDPLGALVDEAWGFDYEFLRVGARSAIGSLYSVPEVMMTLQVARYRQGLLSGASSPAALATAQRAWMQHDLPHLLNVLREHPSDGLARFAAEFGVQLSPSAVRAGDPVAYGKILSCPVIWASFRHVGISDQWAASRAK